jgi:glycosyltransferase involved in cell wall biosynthesis
LWVQDIWPESLQATGFINNRRILKLIEYVVRYIYRFSDSILIQSEGFRSSVQRLSNDTSKIKFFPNSAQDSAVTVEPSSLDMSRVSGQFSVVFAGNVGIAQSCTTIVEAARILQAYKDIRFFIVGSGSMENTIAGMIHDEQLDNIELIGRVSPEEVASIYAASSVLLLTLRDDPTLAATVPSKFQSYLAAGKPIIACCNGQTVQLLAEAKAGLSCAAEDSRQLAESVLELYGSEAAQLEKMGKNGRDFFLGQFHLPAKVSQLIKHFKSLVNKPRD